MSHDHGSWLFGRESVWGSGISTRPNGLGEIPYRPRPIPPGWLTTQVSGEWWQGFIPLTHHPFKLGSPNLDPRCKSPWLILFWGVIDLDLQSQIQLQSQNWPHFELVLVITHNLFKLGSPNLGQRCNILWWKSLLFWELIGLDRSNLTLFKIHVYLHTFGSLKYLWDMQKQSDALFHIPHDSALMLPIDIENPYRLLYNDWRCNCDCQGHNFVILSWIHRYFDTVVMIKWRKMIRVM